MVQLNPGVFIERGLELIEAQARSVFEDIRRLRRVVVLFDECDELFRERNQAGATEQVRSITAFVTASMLPKLQDLHDLGRVVFVICTNNFHSLDGAVKRRGRIDHIVGIGPPDEPARRRIVYESLGNDSNDNDAPGVSRLYQMTTRFTRGELTYLVRQLIQQRTGSATDDALAQRLIEQLSPSLNITDAAYAAYVNEAAEASAPHLMKGLG
jgi:SpoVK/Ycf46/Vps4 family AAA+-type ATPase